MPRSADPTRFFYKLARASAWARAVVAAFEGNPGPLLRRTRNRAAFKALGRALRRRG